MPSGAEAGGRSKTFRITATKAWMRKRMPREMPMMLAMMPMPRTTSTMIAPKAQDFKDRVQRAFHSVHLLPKNSGGKR